LILLAKWSVSACVWPEDEEAEGFVFGRPAGYDTGLLGQFMESGCANQSARRTWHGWPVGVVRRLRGAVVLALAIAILAVLGSLHPDPSGMGTHEQLSIPACSFLATTGWPCPTCGLTTSLAAMAHGDVALGFRAHPFGVMLFLALIAAGLAGGMELLSAVEFFNFGRSVLRPRAWWVLAAGGGLILGWAVKLAVGLVSGELPIR
jgi:hypothetical protein